MYMLTSCTNGFYELQLLVLCEVKPCKKKLHNLPLGKFRRATTRNVKHLFVREFYRILVPNEEERKKGRRKEEKKIMRRSSLRNPWYRSKHTIGEKKKMIVINFTHGYDLLSSTFL